VTVPSIIDKISIPSPFSFNSVQQSVLSADNKLKQLDAARAAGQVAPVIEQSAPEIEQSATQAEQSFPEIELPPSPQAMTPGKVTMISSPAQAKRDLSAAAPGTMAPVTANAALERVKSYNDIIARTADSVGVDPNLLKAMIVEESGAKQHARSSSNAKGLMQLIDTTAQSMGVKNVWDPHQNIQGGARYLKQQLDKYKGDVSLALASYNAGPGNVERYNGIPPFKETRNYVKRVMNLYTALQSLEKNSDEVIK
jgi:soluble lytic murein transglycosylase-like protein